MRLLAVIDIPAWKTLEPGRFNQVYQNEMAERLKLIANSIQNNGATAGIGWKLEPSPVAKADDEAA